MHPFLPATEFESLFCLLDWKLLVPNLLLTRSKQSEGKSSRKEINHTTYRFTDITYDQILWSMSNQCFWVRNMPLGKDPECINEAIKVVVLLLAKIPLRHGEVKYD